MHVYVKHRLLVVVLLTGLIIGSQLTSDAATTQWYVLLVLVMIAGYSHYLVGAVYQLQTYRRLSSPWKGYVGFGVLSALSLLVAYGFISLGQLPLLAFVVIGYFIVHGLLNEFTLYERTVGESANPFAVYAFAAVCLGGIMAAVGHPSWLYSPDLTFAAVDTIALQQYLQTDPLPIIARGVALISFIVALGCAGMAWVRRSRHSLWHGLFFGAIAAFAVVSMVWYPLNYVYALAALLLYHFTVWFLLFLRQFRLHAPARLPSYLGLHVAVGIPFVFLLLPGTVVGEWVEMYLLNVNTFLVLTLLHITVSFMNEPWYKQRFLQ